MDPAEFAGDLLFLAFIAAVYLKQTLRSDLWTTRAACSAGDFGKLMWIRLGIMAVFSLRSIPDPRFGFVPSRSEWRIGFLFYLFFLAGGRRDRLLVEIRPLSCSGNQWWKLALLAPGCSWLFCGWWRYSRNFFSGLPAARAGGSTGSEIAGLATGLRDVWAGAFDVSPLFRTGDSPFWEGSAAFFMDWLSQGAQCQGGDGDACAGGYHVAIVFFVAHMWGGHSCRTHLGGTRMVRTRRGRNACATNGDSDLAH